MSSSKALTTIQRKARVQETVGKFLKAGMVEEAKDDKVEDKNRRYSKSNCCDVRYAKPK